MSRKRVVWISLASAAGLVALASIAGLVVVRSSWFYAQVRERIVGAVERATGGRVEAGAFTFDWRSLRAELKGFVLHGAEPAGKPPLVRADSIAVGLKIISIFERDIDIQYVDVNAPRVYLILYPDGRTNVPEPKIRKPASDLAGSVLRLAIGRFHAWNGTLEVEGRARTPFDVDGRNVAANLSFDARGPRYQGNLAVRPLNLRMGDGAGAPVDVSVALALERNRISVNSATLSTGTSTLEVSGALENLAAPRASFRYDARIALADVELALRRKLPARGGVVRTAGEGTWAGASAYSVAGKWQLSQTVLPAVGAARAEGMVAASPAGAYLSAVRVWTSRPAPVDARIARIDLDGRNVDVRGIEAAFLGGGFHGEARLENLDRFTVKGGIAGIDARRAVAVYSSETLPWDGIVAGSIAAEGALQAAGDWRASVDLTVAPAAQGAPVRGQIAAHYDARSGAIEIARGTLALPSSRAEVSGALGSRMRVYVESRDLNDLLPVLGKSAASWPLKLHNGSIAFDGTATGRLNDLHAAGRLTAGNFTYAGRSFDGFSASVTAASGNVQLRGATLKRGALQAQFQLAVNLDNWKPTDSSLIDGSGTVRNAAASDLAALLGAGPLPVGGTVSVNARLNGTIGDPLVDADATVAKGSFRGEPFDQAAAHVRANQRSIQVTAGQVEAGDKQLRATATFEHAPQVFDAGRLQFEITSNAMPVDEIATVTRARPGVKGSVQIAAQGTLDLAPQRDGGMGLRIEALQGDVTAHGLQLTGQPLGNAHLAVNSEGGSLKAHLDSDFADSSIQGNGEWRLTGDYPGTATLVFSKLDFAALRAWLVPSLANTAAPFNGFAEGQLRIDAALLKPQSARGEIRIPKFQISASAPSGERAGETASLTLDNAGPIVATVENSILTIASARLLGRDTDLAIAGKVALSGKQALDLQVKGRVDLAIVHSFNRDFTASGELAADATVRGTLEAPQPAGQVSFQNAAFRVADLPNGITGAKGEIGFAGDRATIQSFTGETGGGTVTLTGFAGYGAGPVIFRLHAQVAQVRVRYPEGVSTVADATLNLTGTSDRSMLAGTITILRTAFNPQADFSSLVAQSAQPVHTASARAGFLGGLNFDIQIQTAPDIQFESSLTQDVQMEANLRLRGTASNPALLGRINITEGQVRFFGTKYTINQGSISFYNPLRIDPVLDIDLDTKARGIDVTLTVSGPLNKLTLTPRSDPPLQFSEIVALLATGRTPTSDPALLAQQATAPQSWQQMGASALLGQAIASPITGRLERFFGVSNLRIDPTLPGVEYNPQARLTLEQQVTPEITFTYITNVTSSNPQVVRVEWAFAKQWSVVALREENGMFGIDFFYKRRF
jgi:translocation and assembly module TamB